MNQYEQAFGQKCSIKCYSFIHKTPALIVYFLIFLNSTTSCVFDYIVYYIEEVILIISTPLYMRHLRGHTNFKLEYLLNSSKSRHFIQLSNFLFIFSRLL